MVREVVEGLQVKGAGAYVDCTAGEGGHAAAILGQATDSRVLGVDLDADALEAAKRRLERYGERFVAVQANFSTVEAIVRERGPVPVTGVLFDLGLSSLQLETAARGFSFQREAPLDMRFDLTQRLTAADIVNDEDDVTLAELIYRHGEEPRARQVARAIVRARPLRTTTQLADVVAKAIGARRRGRIHPATRTFQALRIAVNDELNNLRRGVMGAINVLDSGGRLVTIAYHSLEDRLIKMTLRDEAADCVCPPQTPQCVCGHSASVRLINRRVVKPTADEVRENPRSRSARMRVAARI